MKNFSYFVDKEMLQENTTSQWGGFLETLQYCEQDEKDENTFVKNLKMKVSLLENSKNMKEIRENISQISEYERNYLNSPLLDEIFETIDLPIVHSTTKNKVLAIKFYMKTYERFIDKNMLLVKASFCGSKDIVEFLLEFGADVKYKNNLPLFSACVSGHIEIIKILIKINLDIDVCNEALGFAVTQNQVDVVKLLLENGADPNKVIVQYTNHTPIITASEKGHLAIVKILIEYGADIHRENDHAFYQAVINGHYNIVKLLMVYGQYNQATLTEALMVSAKYGHEKIIEFLLENGADVHGRSEWALRMACSHGRTETVKILLEHGADIHAAENESMRSSIQYGYIDIIIILLERGARVHASMLKKAIENKHTEIAHILIEHGAIPTFYDRTRLFMQKLFR